MKHSFFFVLFGLVVFTSAFAAEPVGEIDDSSYESLYEVVLRYESRRTAGGWGALLSLPDETLNAIAKFNQLDLLDKDITAFQEAIVEFPSDRSSILDYAKKDYARKFAEKIVEPLFQAGLIDEGITFLKKMLPPQNETEGILAIGYVSDALIEQKRFDPAWQLATCGPVNYGVSHNIYDYVRHIMVKTQTRRSIYNNAPTQDSFVKNEEDREIFLQEANRAFEYFLELPQPADIPDGHRQWAIALTLIALGRYEEAFELYDSVEGKRERLYIFAMIQNENSALAKFDEVERWYEKLRELYGEEETRKAYDHYHAYMLPDALNLYFDKTQSSERASELMTHLMSSILQFNVETGFRYNSKELIERLLKEQKEPFDEPNPVEFYFETRNGQRFRRVHRFHENIIKAQLNLDLVEDALETFRQFQYAFQAIESLTDISYYAVKNKLPEEVERIEAEAIKVFMAFPETSEASNLFSLVTCYARTATRLMNEGEAEKGAQYLKKAIDNAVDEALRALTEKTRYPRSFSYMGILCFSYMGIVSGELARHGFIDEALEIARQFEDRYPMPGLYLFIAETFATDEQQEKAKAALQKAFEVFSQIEELPPSKYGIYEKYHTRMAELAITLGEKELFYKIMDTALNATENRQRTNLLTVFTRQLALYGDKDHPLHAELEAEAVKVPERNDGFGYSRNGYPHLLMACAVNKAILGDHVNARRLLKRAMEVEYAAPIRDRHHGMWEIAPAIIEARSYEKPVTGIK